MHFFILEWSSWLLRMFWLWQCLILSRHDPSRATCLVTATGNSRCQNKGENFIAQLRAPSDLRVQGNWILLIDACGRNSSFDLHFRPINSTTNRPWSAGISFPARTAFSWCLRWRNVRSLNDFHQIVLRSENRLSIRVYGYSLLHVY